MSEIILEAGRCRGVCFSWRRVNKARPAVVLTVENYQLHRPDIIAGLVTTQLPNPLAPTDCLLQDWKIAGLRAPSCFRLFLVTLPQRSVRRIGRLSDADWESIQGCFRKGFGLE